MTLLLQGGKNQLSLETELDGVFQKVHLSFAMIAEPVASKNEPVPACTTEQQVRHDCFFLCLYAENDCGNPVGSTSKYWLVNVSQYKWLIFYRHYQSCILKFCLVLSSSAVHYCGSMLFMEVVSMWVAAVVCWMRESWLFCLYKCVYSTWFGGWFLFFFWVRFFPLKKRILAYRLDDKWTALAKCLDEQMTFAKKKKNPLIWKIQAKMFMPKKSFVTDCLF